MELYGLYLLKSVVWFTGFALVFILFLKNERFFLLNRIFLIAGIMASFIFPLIPVRYLAFLSADSNFVIHKSAAAWISIVNDHFLAGVTSTLSAIYFAGMGFKILLTLKQAKSVLNEIKKSGVIPLRPVKLIKTPRCTSAYSYFSYVFVNPSVTETDLKQIIIHELAHIRQKHCYDLLLAELLGIVQWFNPLVPIYLKLMRQNHEYLADKASLKQTSDPAIYKAALLNQLVGAPIIRLTNPFNYSSGKKRFYMMKYRITSPYRKMKVMLILPVGAFVFFVFAEPNYNDKKTNQDPYRATIETQREKGISRDIEISIERDVPVNATVSKELKSI